MIITLRHFSNELHLDNIGPVGIIYWNGNIWLSDADNNRLVVIAKDGKILNDYFPFQRPMHISNFHSKIYVPEYLSDTIKIISDVGIDFFHLLEIPDAPSAVDVNNDIVVVSDFYNHRIILQDRNHTRIIGKEGHDIGELYYPTDVALYNSLIYVADETTKIYWDIARSEKDEMIMKAFSKPKSNLKLA